MINGVSFPSSNYDYSQVNVVNKQSVTNSSQQQNVATNYTSNSVDNYDAYPAVQNEMGGYFPQNLYANLQAAQNLLNNFNKKYPTVESSSMVQTMALHDKTISEDYVNQLTDKYIDMLENRPLCVYSSDEKYIEQLKQERIDYNMANCGEIAYLLQDDLNKSGVTNKVVQIDGDKNYESHVFNVINLAPNADVQDPQTWGDDALIIDAWSNKVMPKNIALNYYNDFFGFKMNNDKMSFTECNLTKMRENNLEDYSENYEKSTGKPLTDSDLTQVKVKDCHIKH